MTLKELSPLYLESARLISERMSLLRRQRRETDDPQALVQHVENLQKLSEK